MHKYTWLSYCPLVQNASESIITDICVQCAVFVQEQGDDGAICSVLRVKQDNNVTDKNEDISRFWHL